MSQKVLEQLIVKIEGALVSTICLDFTIYTKSNFFENGCPEGVLDYYEQVKERYGGYFKWYETENSTRPKKVDEKALDMLPFWLSEKSKRRGEYILLLRSGEVKDDIGTVSFEMTTYGKERIPGFLRLSLPPDLFMPCFNEYRDLCIKLTRKLPFLSGHAGFSLRWNEDSYEYYRQGLTNRKLIDNRYPGIDLPEDSMTILEPSLLTGIRPIGWLTFLAPEFVDKLGGIEKLKDDLGEDIPVIELPHGVMIQAGPEPGTGDVNKLDYLPYYHKVGKCLKSIRMQSHRPIVENMDEWMGRFDEDPEQ